MPQAPGHLMKGCVNLWVIRNEEVGSLRQNGCDKILLTNELGDLLNQIMGAPEFRLFPMTFNYKYRPND